MNLAIPFWGLAEPGVVEQKKLGSSVSYTLWDRWDVKLGETATLKQFVDYFQVNLFFILNLKILY